MRKRNNKKGLANPLWMIVDDDLNDVVQVSVALTELGYKSVTVPPFAAPAYNETDRPAVVQLDDLNGHWHWMFEELRRRNPDAHYILFSARKEYHRMASRQGLQVFAKEDGHEALIDYARRLLEGE